MDWMQGQHLSEWCQSPFTSEQGQNLGQTLWDFYMYQMHVLGRIHADPHPGNFLIDDQDNLMVIDFGCLKEIPEDFYGPYFELAQKENLQNPEYFERQLYALEILKPEDSPKEKEFFRSIFHEMLSLFTKPFHGETFDFSNQEFFDQIGELGQKYANDSALKEMNGNRGSKHFIYINRTFFGLYNLMFDLKAKDVVINNFKKYTHGAPAQQAVLV
jgi:predicted unusual protein kinase regulating ubiquinone biosynthesis (AarF/ABC1/UbiB family)